VIDERIEARRRNNKLYRQLLSGLDELTFHTEPSEAYFSNYWLTAFYIDKPTHEFNRETIRLALAAENIESRPLWKPMHLQPVFKKLRSYLNGISENFFNKGLCLPSGSNLKIEDLERIAGIIRRVRS
jgi:dTDP-4-amino-4,6-dideoxygalactose transaminase